MVWESTFIWALAATYSGLIKWLSMHRSVQYVHTALKHLICDGFWRKCKHGILFWSMSKQSDLWPDISEITFQMIQGYMIIMISNSIWRYGWACTYVGHNVQWFGDTYVGWLKNNYRSIPAILLFMSSWCITYVTCIWSTVGRVFNQTPLRHHLRYKIPPKLLVLIVDALTSTLKSKYAPSDFPIQDLCKPFTSSDQSNSFKPSSKSYNIY